MKKALICGINGQDGAYLAKHLITEGYLVFGTSRDAETSTVRNLGILGIDQQIKIYSASLNDFRSVIQVLNKTQPDEVYNLSGQSSVGLSFEQPVETFNSITLATLNLLEAVRFYNPAIKVYNAASSECFGDTVGQQADEKTVFSPRSPYAVAKCAAFWYVTNYREAYNLFACSGILFNHESPFRPNRFVTQKIINSVINIYEGKQQKLELGNLDIYRDWGWAPEYVTAMHLMLQQSDAEDYVIATGNTHSLKEFVMKAFEYFNLNWEKYLVINSELIRPTDIKSSIGNPEKALKNLGWKAKFTIDDIIKEMIEFQLIVKNNI
jgi:GDPmannose 4,6-dehydratase